MPKAVLWDMDGTLVDSADAILSAANAALVGAGLPARQGLDLKPLIGKPIRDIFASWGAPSSTLDDLVTTYRARYDAGAARPYDGIQPILAQLAQNGIGLAIVTTKGEALALRALRGVAFDKYFKVIIGDDGQRPLKPRPEPVMDACAALGVSPSDATMVGDTLHDLEAAKSAGVAFVGVAWGYGNVQSMEQAGAKVAITRTELARLLGAT